MSAENCLILAAGFGTRMGEIGKVLPKVLWPVFEKTILELQVAYARELGCRNIFINTHYLPEQVDNHISSNLSGPVTTLHEPDLLRIGGAIHRVAKICENNENQNLLVLNGDLFYFFEREVFEKAMIQITNNVAVLFGVQISGNDNYNRLVVEEEKLVEITSAPTKQDKYLTYSGMSIVNMKKLNITEGASDFFDTVADYKNESVLVASPQKSEYWDFGTSNRYHSSMIQLLKMIADNDCSGQFLSFCRRNGVINEDHINSNSKSYGQIESDELINLSEMKIDASGIHYQDIFQECS